MSLLTALADLCDLEAARDPQEPASRPWRGSLPWERPYGTVLAEWQARDPLKRPPAFQDGVARPEQLLPGTPGAWGAVNAATGEPITREDEWTYWLVRSGRGFGKTRLGAEAVIEWARAGIGPILVAGATSTDVRDTLVETGESSILKVAPADFRPVYEPSKLRLTFPNGVLVWLRSADEPERFRGIQFVRAWLDELAAWKRLDAVWEQIHFVMRVKRPDAPVQLAITTTPKPHRVLRELSRHPRCALTVRSSRDNLANLAEVFRQAIEDLEGTRLGRQEIDAEILEDVEGALWRLAQIEALRVRPDPERRFQRIVVGVDPPGGATECGIVVAGLSRSCPAGRPGCPGHGYVLEDLSTAGPPHVWGQAVVDAYHGWGADRVVAEANFGGDMVEHTIRSVDPRVPVKVVRASRGKQIRAEPISALSEGAHPRVHHAGVFPRLESEMTSWTPDASESPNRLDALVWAMSELLLGRPTPLVAPTVSTRKTPWR